MVMAEGNQKDDDDYADNDWESYTGDGMTEEERIIKWHE